MTPSKWEIVFVWQLRHFLATTFNWMTGRDGFDASGRPVRDRYVPGFDSQPLHEETIDE